MTEDTSEPREKQDKGIARRDFLKIAATGTAALSTRKVNTALREIGVLDEGNLFQATGSLSENIVKVMTEGGETKDAFAAWLKFNAAKFYADQNGMPTAAAMVNHFLYGEGKPYDIGNEYLGILRKAAEEKPGILAEAGYATDGSISDIDLLVLHTQHVLQDSRRFGSLDYDFKTGQRAEPVILDLDTNTQIELSSLQNVVGKSIEVYGAASGFTLSRDIVLSLGKYRYGVKGRVASVVGGEVFFEEGSEILLQDRYDWEVDNQLVVNDTMRAFVENSGLSNKLRLSEEVLKELEEVNLEITDAEGQLLVDTGMAHEFDVRASYQVDKSFSLVLR